MRFFGVLAFLLFPIILFAQKSESAGWVTFINNTHVNKKLAIYFDAQLRSEADWQHVHNVLFRTGLAYGLNKKSALSVGYFINDTFNRNIGASRQILTEHQIFEQFTYRQNLRTTMFTHRLRTGQRFIEKNDDYLFAQSFQYFIRALIPLSRPENTFSKGPFIGLQDEVFLNIQHKDKLNGSYFDQNRAYAAVGYRLNPKIDIEAGYLNHDIKGKVLSVSNNILQMVLYTRF